MAFYHPRCIDRERGGFFHFFKDDGTIYDADTRHLVSSTRFVFNYAMAFRRFGDPDYQDAVRHGLAFLRSAHRNPATGGYAWLLGRGNEVLDGTNHCYGLAFVVLAYAKALEAGIEEARGAPRRDLAAHGAAFLVRGATGSTATRSAPTGPSSRPIAARTPTCTAARRCSRPIEATGDAKYLDRAERLARRVTIDLAGKADGLVWEHYDADWNVDWDYNRDDPKHLFRPWGYQPGHQTEWAKLLLILGPPPPGRLAAADGTPPVRHRHAAGLGRRARRHLLRLRARPFDLRRRQVFLGPGRELRRRGAARAPAPARSATGAGTTGSGTTRWRHMVDHQYGAWFRILDQRNEKYSDEKSPAGKTDYHTMGACYEALNVVGD